MTESNATMDGTMTGGMRRLPVLAERVFWWALGTLAGGTLAWIVWGVLTPGDFLGQGSLLLPPSLVAAGAAGGYVAVRHKGRPLRITLLVLAVLFSMFWLLAHDGWWVKPPPGRPHHLSSPR